MGMANPSLNIPLKPTRALFQLGWGNDGTQRVAWRDGTPDERRAILAALPGGLVDIPVSAFTTPAWPFGIDWFASPADLRAVPNSTTRPISLTSHRKACPDKAHPLAR